MPKVSVIVPVYNVEDYIEKCLNSLLNQTIEDLEIIVVNDGSNDRSKEKILKIMEQNPNKIKYLEKENGGLSSARNYAIPYATGEYIAFLDSDDYVENNMYEEMYNKAKEENSDMVECDFIWEYPNKKRFDKGEIYQGKKEMLYKAKEENSDMVECDFIWEYPNKKRFDKGEIYQGKKEMLYKARVVAWNKLIKLEKIKNIEFPNELRYEDVEFFYKLVPYLEKVSFVKKYFIHYLQRKTSIANTQNERTKDIFIILENVINYYKEKNLYQEYEEQLEYIYVRFLLCSSLKRMCKITNKKEKRKALEENWNNINTKFPNWKKNKILKQTSIKNLYIRSNNKFTYKIYCLILSII